MDSDVVIAAEGLTKRYGSLAVVNNASLCVSAGEIVGLVGKNGAGKSTIIKMLSGAVHPDEGTIVVSGRPVHIRNPLHASQLGLAFVHQELAGIGCLSVAENVYLGLGYPRRLRFFVDRARLFRDAKVTLDKLGAHIDPSVLMSTLSIADQRLVMIGRALAQRTQLVVLDEPSASLTREETDRLHETLRRLRDDGVSTIYVSHRLDEILALTDRVVVMRDAHIVGDHATSELTYQRLVELITGSVRDEQASDGRRSRGARGRPAAPDVLVVEGLARAGAVHDVSFTLRAGELLGFAGMVGAGRTETARLIFGADPRSRGRILVDGAEVACGSPREAMAAGIALLPEDRHTEGAILDFSIRHNLTLPTLGRHRVRPYAPVPSTRSERREAMAQIEGLSIAAARDSQDLRELSGGNQQKVVIGKWMAHDTKILICDEPTNGVDVAGKDEIYALMERLASEGKGVIFISSEFSELVAVCHRVLVFRDGRVVGELCGDQITEAAIVERCYDARSVDLVDSER
jgi:ABC-type sugar transport system ATPase subunit